MDGEREAAPLTERNSRDQQQKKHAVGDSSPDVSSVKQVSTFEDRAETILLRRVDSSNKQIAGDRSSSFSTVTNKHLRDKKLST